jgi:hypothetical protein
MLSTKTRIGRRATGAITLLVCAAINCDPAEQDGNQVEKTALLLMNLTDEELMAGDQAVQDLIAHLKRMKAAGTTQRVPDVRGERVVSVEWKSNGQVN